MTMQEYLEATAFAVKRMAASMTGEDDQFWTTYSGLGVSQLSANNALPLRAVIHRLSAAALASALLQIAKHV